MAACKPSGFLPPAVAKKACPPPPPCISFAASRTTAPAFTPQAVISSPSITVSVGFPSQTEPTTKTSLGERWRRL